MTSRPACNSSNPNSSSKSARHPRRPRPPRSPHHRPSPPRPHGSRRTALSFGLSYAFNENATFKAEYRLDRAQHPVFLAQEDGSYRKSNRLLGMSVVVFF